MGDHLPLDAHIFLLDYSDDARALLDHLRLEAPDLLSSVVVITPDTEVVARLRHSGIHAACADPWDINAALDVGVERARFVAIFPENPAARADKMLRLVRGLRRLCRTAKLFAKAGTRADAERLYAAGATEVFVVAEPAPSRTGRSPRRSVVDTP